MLTQKQNNQKLIDEGYMDGKKSFDYLYDQIAEYFDFKKVYKVMKALDWGWSINGTTETYIPTVEALKIFVHKKCKEVYENERAFCSGGFEIRFKNNILSVAFVAVEWAGE